MIALFPELVSCAGAGDIERLAILTRRYFATNNVFAPILDTNHLTASMGIELTRILGLNKPPSILARDEQGVFEVAIVIAESHDEAADRFLVAHLVGHFLLHMQPSIAAGEWQVAGFGELTSPQRRYEQDLRDASLPVEQERHERQADDFAAALLLPKPMLLRAEQKLTSALKLASFFGVTEATVRRRLDQVRELGEAPKSFVEAERAIGRDDRASKDDATSAKELHAPTIKMPRSVATGSYSQAAKSTEPKPASAKDRPAGDVETDAMDKAMAGIRRLRNIAKKIDRSID